MSKLRWWMWRLNPMNWGFRKDAEVVADIATRAMNEGSTVLNEDECDAVIRWGTEYAKRSKEKQSKLRLVRPDAMEGKDDE